VTRRRPGPPCCHDAAPGSGSVQISNASSYGPALTHRPRFGVLGPSPVSCTAQPCVRAGTSRS
jgi:hypothetical protein